MQSTQRTFNVLYNTSTSTNLHMTHTNAIKHTDMLHIWVLDGYLLPAISPTFTQSSAVLIVIERRLQQIRISALHLMTLFLFFAKFANVLLFFPHFYFINFFLPLRLTPQLCQHLVFVFAVMQIFRDFRRISFAFVCHCLCNFKRFVAGNVENRYEVASIKGKGEDVGMKK